MKIYTKVVIDIASGDVLEEESFEYQGPVSQAFGGGTGAGGGGDGKADWPEYMKSWHMTMLTANYDVINAERQGPPATYRYDPRVWLGFISPTTPIVALAEIVAYDTKAVSKAILNPLDATYYMPLGYDRISPKQALVDGLLASIAVGTETSAAIQEIIDTFSSQLLAKYTASVEPKLSIGFRDAGAVVGTSFNVAKAIALRDYQREVADFTAKMHIHFHDVQADIAKSLLTYDMQMTQFLWEVTLKRVGLEMEHIKLTATYAHDTASAITEAMGKYGVLLTEDSIKRKTYQLDLLEHMNKAMASISGASSVRQGEGKGSEVFKSAIGMGLTGAAAGAYLGAKGALGGSVAGPGGAAIGGVIGVGVGIIGGLLR